MGEASIRRGGYRSLFWPIVLIAIGAVWLLSNLGVLTGANLVVLFRLWPLLLIVVGLDLLFGRQSPLIGALIGIGAVVVIVALMLVGPSIGLAGPSLDVKLSTFSEPRGDATSAQIQLDLSVAETTVAALTDPSDLFTADVSHVGELEYSVAGETSKVISLRQEDVRAGFFDGPQFLGPLFGGSTQNLYWNIGLNPDVPVELTVNSGVGNSVFNLREVQLRRFQLNSGVGTIKLQLPSVEETYDVNISGGTGAVEITVADDAAANITVHGGVGGLTIDVPDNAAVRVAGSSGIGNITVPGTYRRVSGDDSNFVGSEGAWESSNYAESSRRITIEFAGGVGGLTVR